MAAPASGREPGFVETLRAFARCVAQHKSGALLDIPEVPLELLDEPVSGDKNYLRSLETLHRSIVLYLWLSYRCGGIFTDRTLATHVKELVEMKMDRALTEFSANRKLRKVSSLRRQVALLRQSQEREQAYTVERGNLVVSAQGGITGSRDSETMVGEVLDDMDELGQFSTATA
jgi:ATP-dependent RNA helicase SUPV3L1/SUV3